MSHPRGLPDLFLDRSLGRKQVPRILRAVPLRLTTLAEHYGMPQDADIADVTWIRDATAAGWALLMKDEAVTTTPAERAVLETEGARAFCLARKDLRAPGMAGWFLAALDEMAEACTTVPAPFMFAVERSGLRRLI